MCVAHVNHLLKTKKENKSIKKQQIQNILIKTTSSGLVTRANKAVIKSKIILMQRHSYLAHVAKFSDQKHYLAEELLKNQLLKNLKNEKFPNLLKTIFGVLISQICN